MMTFTTIPTMQLPSGEAVPILGQGTWGMGEDPRRSKAEAATLRFGLDLGMTPIDTAEMYGEGGDEAIVVEAISGRRDEVFVVSKFYPHHTTHQGMMVAYERSLKRLKTDRLDLYLLHWRGSVPLQETLEGFDALVRAGKIRYWGVSNFDLGDLEALVSWPMGATIATNQVLYNPLRRGIEWDLLPWCRKRNIPIIAYSPVEQGRLLDHPTLKTIAARHGATPAQIALAWLSRQAMMAIPKASHPEHIRENRQALEIHLADEDIKELDRAFPPPNSPSALAMR